MPSIIGKRISNDLDSLIDTITTDADGEEEQFGAFRQALEDELGLPAKATVIGQPVTVLEIDYPGNQRMGLTATIRTKDGTKYDVAMADVAIADSAKGGQYLAAYRKWLGLDALSPVVDPSSSFSLITLSVKQRLATCRISGSSQTVNLRLSKLRELVPGELALFRATDKSTNKGILHLSGTVEATRIDAAALDLVPLKVEERGRWSPEEHYWGEPGARIETWAKPIIAQGPRLEFEMEQVLPNVGDESDYDPIIEANDLSHSGDKQGATRILMDLCSIDLRCLDAHSHLGNLLFPTMPEDAIRHYEVGFRIGEMSLGKSFNGLLPWGWIDNRPLLRCMQGYGLCLWRLERWKEAAQIFERMLWLNPTDNQGSRFLLADVKAKRIWTDSD